MNAKDMSGRALLAGLTISVWTGRRFDQKASDDVANHNAAHADAGRYTKRLIAGAAAHMDVVKLATAARADHYKLTLPWSDDGKRILPGAGFLPYSDRMRQAKSAFLDAVATFTAAYPQLVQAEPARLGALYRADDYLSAAEVEKCFAFEVTYDPIPVTGDFRVALPSEEIAALERQVTARVEAAGAAAMRDAWGRLHKVVAHMAARLGDPAAKLYDSVVLNVAEVCEILPALNLAGDPALDRMVEEVRARLTVATPNDLRADAPRRADVARQAQGILAAMRGLYGAEVA